MTKTICLNANVSKGAALLISFLLILSTVASSQEDKPRKRNALFIELTGNEPAYSVNYDRIFSQRELVNYSCRIGFSMGKDELYFPVGINVFTGKKASHLELSLVLAPYIKQYEERGHDKGDAYLYIIPGVGYRYQHRKAGPFLKLVASPAVLVDAPKDLAKMQSSVHAALYFSAGYSF